MNKSISKIIHLESIFKSSHGLCFLFKQIPKYATKDYCMLMWKLYMLMKEYIQMPICVWFTDSIDPKTSPVR